jgi:uncharacterized protein YqeY
LHILKKYKKKYIGKDKTQEICKDTIEKLTTAHISGFELMGYIKTKFSQKYKSSKGTLQLNYILK